jgi:anti-sigma B factor antagonist
MVDIEALRRRGRRAELTRAGERIAHLPRPRAAAHVGRPAVMTRTDAVVWTGDGFGWRAARSDGCVVARLSGELDLAASPALEALRDRLLADAPARVVIDLRELEFIDSTGLHWLLSLQPALPRSSRLEFVRGPESVDAVLSLTGLTGRFTFVSPDEGWA